MDVKSNRGEIVMDKNLEKVGLREEIVEVDFQAKLIKNLGENEIICTDCKGTGLKLNDNPFGIRDFKHPNGRMFPFKKQTISFCQSCYNGVQKLCTYCNETLPRHTAQCDCDQAKAERAKISLEKEMERFNKASKITLEEALSNYDFLYIDNFDKYIETDDFNTELDDILYDLKEDDDEFEFKREDLRIYVTKQTSLIFDAGSVVENNMDDLHEEAYDRIGNKKMEELQELLEKWAESVKNDTLTYYADYKIAVQL